MTLKTPSSDRLSSTSSSESASSEASVQKLDVNDLDILKLLGTGHIGRVFLARHRSTSQLLALKVITKTALSPQECAGVLREQCILEKLCGATVDHALFTRLMASWHDEQNFYMALEYIAGGDLAIELGRCGTFDEERVRLYAAEIITTLEVLHAQGVVHRDIKPANLLFRPNGHLVLADFGHSLSFDTHTHTTGLSSTGQRLVSSPNTTGEVCGTPYYMSPEMHAGLQYSYDVDLWALGVMMYRMLTRRMPLGGDTIQRSHVGGHVLRDPVLFETDDRVSPSARSLLQRMLAKDAHQRLDLRSLKSHPFFADTDWDKIKARRHLAPWTPFVSPIPKIAKTSPGFQRGRPYDDSDDPFPQFTFTAPCFSLVDAVAVALPELPISSQSTCRLRATVRKIFHCSRLIQKRATPRAIHLSDKENDPFLDSV
ncbi:kinase-like domain-containing protein [Schizophyllum amplum]|uniref:non-specific serine/threonine protein kinase n=1 Tax=Schizophyllum amplum TaxID=97359 RepID=A0A550CXG9_9AGAR|nr:kinase-like domain-containing protein [Auriculariopsis ampla]